MRHLRHLQIVATILKADLARTVAELAAELEDERTVQANPSTSRPYAPSPLNCTKTRAVPAHIPVWRPLMGYLPRP
jgi:hypothetical protein